MWPHEAQKMSRWAISQPDHDTITNKCVILHNADVAKMHVMISNTLFSLTLM